MSGIKNLKERSKIQLDEMFNPKSVGKPERQKDGKEEEKNSMHLDTQQPINPLNQPLGQSKAQPSNPMIVKEASPENNQTLSEKLDTHPAVKPKILTTSVDPIFQTKSPSKKSPTYKMTFNLTEDIYKAFNDLYANRILQGRKTEKSEMICEAIQWLIQMEKKYTN